MFVPVVNLNNEPLMPTIPSRARRMIKSKKATPFWKQGVFCIRLNYKSEEHKQEIVVGVDPGSKQEGLSVKSNAHTYLNIQADAITCVKDKMEARKNLRRARRFRNTPCRQPRFNNKRKEFFLPPSTKARWQWKLRIINWLKKVIPINNFIVEDIAAKTKKGQKKWNKSFSPLEVGKNWFYEQLSLLGKVETKKGYETKVLRDELGLKKIKNNAFYAHCVDSWVLANCIVGGHSKPDNINILFIKPLNFYRRQLHVMKPAKGGIRKTYGGTRSLGFKRGSFVKHKKLGLTYVGGTSKNRISLYGVKTGERLARNIKPEDCKFLCYNSWIKV